MTDHEQAVKDVMAVAQNRPGHMTTLDAYRSYAVAQREARLRLEDALNHLSEAVFNRGIDDPASAKAYNDACAALDAVKEG